MHAARTDKVIFLDLIILTTFSKENNYGSPHYAVTSSFVSLVPPQSKQSPQHTILNFPHLCSSPPFREEVYACEAKGKVTVLHIFHSTFLYSRKEDNVIFEIFMTVKIMMMFFRL